MLILKYNLCVYSNINISIPPSRIMLAIVRIILLQQCKVPLRWQPDLPSWVELVLLLCVVFSFHLIGPPICILVRPAGIIRIAVDYGPVDRLTDVSFSVMVIQCPVNFVTQILFFYLSQ